MLHLFFYSPSFILLAGERVSKKEAVCKREQMQDEVCSSAAINLAQICNKHRGNSAVSNRHYCCNKPSFSTIFDHKLGSLFSVIPLRCGG